VSANKEKSTDNRMIRTTFKRSKWKEAKNEKVSDRKIKSNYWVTKNNFSSLQKAEWNDHMFHLAVQWSIWQKNEKNTFVDDQKVVRYKS